MKKQESNKEKIENVEQDKLNKERDARCVPIALQMIEEFGSFKKHNLTSQNKTETFEAYNELAKKFVKAMLYANIPVGEYNYIHQLILKGFEEMNSIVLESINKHLRDAQEKKFGCQIYEIPFQDLHEILSGAKMESPTKAE